MSFSTESEDSNWVYQKSHSPTSHQPYQHIISTGALNNHVKSQNYYNKRLPQFRNHKQYYFNRHPYKGYYHPYSFQSKDQYKSLRYAKQSHAPPTYQKSSSAYIPNDGESNNDVYLNEAIQAYDIDKTTVAEVTQLLIYQDKDIEERLLRAMKSVLLDLKKRHDRHIEFVKNLIKDKRTEAVNN